MTLLLSEGVRMPMGPVDKMSRDTVLVMGPVMLCMLVQVKVKSGKLQLLLSNKLTKATYTKNPRFIVVFF